MPKQVQAKDKDGKMFVNNCSIENNNEYLTGRIIDGKPEYGKRINVGRLSNGINQINHGITFGSHYVIDYTNSYWYANDNNSHFTLTYQSYIASAEVSKTTIVIVTNNANVVNYNFVITILYTKP